MTKKTEPLRAQAARLLTQVIRNQKTLSELLDGTNKPSDPRDQALLQELCYGTCRWFFQLQSILDLLTQKPFKPKDTDLRMLALMGLYQLIHMQTPDHAAVSETVNAAQALGKRWASGLLNAVLRRFLREQSSLLSQTQQQDEACWSLPQWLIDQIQHDWPDQAEMIRKGSLERPPMTLRANQCHQTREAYLNRLQSAQLPCRALTETQSGIQLDHPCAVGQLPGFDEGDVSVQDGAAQLATELLQLQPGQTVLDACAAPGGKTAHILESEPRLTRLVAIDVQENRCAKLQQTLFRLGLAADIICADARQPQDWHDGVLFDRILLDAPCSATGVIRRHPDIKLLRTPKDILNIQHMQQQLLDALWMLVKPGGLLLYTTCSILKSENQGQIESFLSRHADTREHPMDQNWGVACSAGRQRFPGEQGMDGFYYARLVKAT